MKRFVSVFLLVVSLMGMASSMVAYADSPISVSDRITTDLYNLQLRKEDIEAKRRAQISAARAKTQYSNCSSEELVYYINRKTLTKREYEAFKWSFIFSQFANPLEDNLLDVLNHPFFKSLAEDEFNIESVLNSIRGGSVTGETSEAQSNTFSDDINFMMLQNVDFAELTKTIRNNYAIYPLVKASSSQEEINPGRVYLEDILKGEFPLYMPLYLYDTKVVPDAGDEEYLNACYYQQDRLDGNSYTGSSSGTAKKPKIKNIYVPVAFYDASFALYTQLAVSAFLKAGNDPSVKSVDDLIARHGNSQLCIDSFGNICLSMNGNLGSILVPNFGNTALINEYDNSNGYMDDLISLIDDAIAYTDGGIKAGLEESKGSLEDALKNTVEAASKDPIAKAGILSRINLYNNWLVSQYSDVTRGRSTIYPDAYELKLSNGNAHSHDLRVQNGSSLANTYVLVENGMVDPGDQYLWDITNLISKDSGNKNQAVWEVSHSDRLAYMGKWLSTGFLTPRGVRVERNNFWDFYSNNSANLYTHRSGDFISVLRDQNNVKNWGDFVGSYECDFNNVPATYAGMVSTYNRTTQLFAPFVTPALSNKTTPTESDKELIEYFENKHPIIKSKMRINGGGDGNGQLPEQYSNLPNSLSTKWNYTHFYETNDGSGGDDYIAIHDGSCFTSGINKNQSDSSSMTAYNSCAALLMQLNDKQIIKDKKFVSTSVIDASGTDLAALWLPKEAIDVGQDMSAFAYSTEKGMFLAEYEQIYDGCLLQFRESLRNYLDDVVYSVKKDNYINVKYEKASDRIVFKFKLVTDKSDSNGRWTVRPSTVNTWFSFSCDAKKLRSCKLASSNTNVPITPFRQFILDLYNVDDIGDLSYFSVNQLLWNEQAESNNELSNRVIVPIIFEYIKSCVIQPDDPLKCAATYDIKDAGWDWFTVTATPASLRMAVEEICAMIGANAEELLNCIYCGMAEVNPATNPFNIKDLEKKIEIGLDALHKGSSSIYDEYTYRLRSLYGVSDKIECSNGDELANVIYYWDRYYLNKTAFNTAMSANLYEQYASIKSCSQDYDAYLAAMLKSSLEYPFSEYIKDFSSKGNVPNYTDIKAPFINEYALQVRSFTDWLNSDEHGVSVSHMNDVSDALKFYEYLHDDTIIVYPFGWDKYYSSITLYAGAGDSMLNTATTFTSDKEKYEQVMAARIGQTISPIQTIMSLQKNTDFIRNSGVVTKPNLKKQTSKVTKEDLMNSAMEFFKHPVTTLSYILTGFLYKVHEAVATGNLGSVFSLNYMLESDAYKWIMDRYISIITLALAVVLFLKLIQFALSKSKNFGHLGRSVIGIFAMCLVPVIVFNSFVWGINATSHWALSGVTNKMLLAQIDKYGTNVNNDANVTKEINAFKEQFAGIAGEWTTLQVQEIDKYSPVAGPSYNIKPVTSYTDNVRFSAADKLWYDTQNFVPVHMNRYSDSYFYYFYDYIKSTYYKYCVDNNKFEVSSFIEDYKTINDTNKLPSGDEASIKMVQNTENVLNTLQGHFIEMLYDTQYVYGNSINALYSSRYGGAQVKDLVGIYNIFSTDQLEFIKTLQSSKEFLALLDSDLMNVTSGSGAKYWANSDVIGEYVISQAAKQNGTRGDVNGKFPVMTSIHDAFNSNLNSKANSVDMSEKATSIILTPLEEKMCKVVTEIYDDTVASLEYLPDQIHDEAAISLMAFIATFKFNEAFGLEPVAPLEESIYLDTVVRTAFVTDLNMVASNTNALYAMIAQGDSVGKIALVVVLELIITVASVLRTLIVLYITVASFVILALRLLHKAPTTTDLVYGIIFNILTLLVLHALTLFLVVIAIEWVAGATSAIPGIVLDLLMILFAVFLIRIMFKLIKNLAKDAINIGGAKIKAGIHSMASSIVNLAGKIKGEFSGEMHTEDVTLQVNRMAPLAVPAGVALDENMTDAQRERVMCALRVIGQMQVSEDSPDYYAADTIAVATAEGDNTPVDTAQPTQATQQARTTQPTRTNQPAQTSESSSSRQMHQTITAPTNQSEQSVQSATPQISAAHERLTATSSTPTITERAVVEQTQAASSVTSQPTAAQAKPSKPSTEIAQRLGSSATTQHKTSQTATAQAKTSQPTTAQARTSQPITQSASKAGHPVTQPTPKRSQPASNAAPKSGRKAPQQTSQEPSTGTHLAGSGSARQPRNPKI